MQVREDPFEVKHPGDLFKFVKRLGMPHDGAIRSHFQDVLAKLSRQELIDLMKHDVTWCWIASELLEITVFMSLAVTMAEQQNNAAVKAKLDRILSTMEDTVSHVRWVRSEIP